jgi:Cof subfamily protein (haloacid dehalogenase superfamily)
MNYSLLATDLDGTLFNEEKEIAPSTIKAIHEFRSKGGRVVICSGRSPLSTKWIAEIIGLKGEPIIAYNGAILLNEQGKVWEQFTFQNETVLSFLDACQSEGIYAHVYEGDTLLIPEEGKWNQRWIENNIPALVKSGGRLETCESYRKQCCVKLIENFPAYIREHRPAITKMAVFHESGLLRDFSTSITHTFADLEISSSLNYRNLEISPAGITKAAALVKLVSHLGMPLSETAAIGDNYNDVLMLKTAGLGIAMGNAPEEVRLAANVVTCTNNEDGVGSAIREFLLL